MTASVLTADVFTLMHAHRTGRDAEALARLLCLGFESTAEGSAARDHLLEAGIVHFVIGDGGDWVARWYPELRPLRRAGTGAVRVLAHATTAGRSASAP